MASGSSAQIPFLSDSDRRYHCLATDLLSFSVSLRGAWIRPPTRGPRSSFVHSCERVMVSVRTRHTKHLGAAIVAVLVAAACASAQETPRQRARRSRATLGCRCSFPPARPAAARADRPDSPVLTPQPGDPIRLRTKDGKFEWSIYGADFEKFVEFLRSKESTDHNEPDYSISSISITGSCDDERAQLTAKFEIQVERDGVWLAVPIGMQEASLVPGMRQTGAGEFRSDPSSIASPVTRFISAARGCTNSSCRLSCRSAASSISGTCN